MALLNRPLTADEIARLTFAGSRGEVWSYNDRQFYFMAPRHQTVRYRGALARVDYERRDTFYGVGPESPSDCVWIVPGVLQ
ncbi:hypothetical protein ACRAVF_19195 [Bradyrhizobium oligotrophicum S58]